MIRRSIPAQTALCSALSLALALTAPTAGARNLDGPGSTHTVNQGDATEFWELNNGAELTIAPGGATSFILADASTIRGRDVVINTGIYGLNLSNGSQADIVGGSINITTQAGAGSAESGSTMNLESLTVTSLGRGLSATGPGSLLSIKNSTIAAGGEALAIGNGASLVIDHVKASSDGSYSGAGGYGLSMSGGTAVVSNSELSGTSTGVQMSAGTLQMSNSTVTSSRTGLIMSPPIGGAAPAPIASVSNSEIQGSTGVVVGSGAELTVQATTIRGIGTSGAGASVNNSTFVATDGSLIEGARRGLELNGSPSTLAVARIDGSRIVSTGTEGIFVSGTANADISLSNGATIESANGILLNVDRSVDANRTNFTVDASSLTGDLVAGRGATMNVALDNRSSLTGVITNGADVSLRASNWMLTGDSSVAKLSVLEGSALQLGNGSSFNTLDVAGNYAGNGGTVIFNTVLAGDDSLSDRLVIGGDTSGNTAVRVNNVGGAGAQTAQGIELISVGGASDGQFELAGRAVGGQYDYFLFKGAGADGNWYLRSQLPTQPDPCTVDPTLPECQPEPVLRPEGGAYLANLTAAQGMFRIGYHERQAGQNGGRGWARVDGTRTGFGAQAHQLDITGNSQAITLGADLLRGGNGSAFGVMLASGNASSTSSNPLTGYYARGKVKGEALGLYGTWRARAEDPYAGFYVDGTLQRAQFRNRVEGVGLEAERYDSKAWQGALESGYAFRVGGRDGSSVYLEPQVQIGYNRWDSLRHTEANGTVVTSSDSDGLFGRLGVRLSGVTRWGSGTAEVQPYLAAHWLHARAASEIRMDDDRVDAHIPRSRAEVSAGASIKFNNGMGVWGGLSLQKSSDYHQTTAQIGVSYSW